MESHRKDKWGKFNPGTYGVTAYIVDTRFDTDQHLVNTQVWMTSKELNTRGLPTTSSFHSIMAITGLKDIAKPNRRGLGHSSLLHQRITSCMKVKALPLKA
jgi:hypothetical protein